MRDVSSTEGNREACKKQQLWVLHHLKGAMTVNEASVHVCRQVKRLGDQLCMSLLGRL